MSVLNELIKQMHPISLQEMDGVKLLNRVDTKFVCSAKLLPDLFKSLGVSYRILTIHGKRMMSYHTKYYDTEIFEMYYKHHHGKLNRYKVREREYVDSKMKFLEVKFKSNKNRTEKSRLLRSEKWNGFSHEDVNFLEQHVPFDTAKLECKLKNSFKRITLTNGKERVTIDFGLHFKNASDVSYLPFVAIIEIKQDKQGTHSKVSQILKELGVRPSSFSKYCVGAALLYPKLKCNRFKRNLLLIDKITA